MYRSIANFGIWCTSPIPPPPNHTATISTIASTASSINPPKIKMTGLIPEFNDNMVRQRISTHGIIRKMEPASEIPVLSTPPDRICVIHAGPTKRWLTVKEKWDIRYAKEKRRVQLARGKEYAEAQSTEVLDVLAGEMPPPSALVGRPSIQMAIAEGQAQHTEKRNLVAWLWSKIGGKEDRVKELGGDRRV